MEKYSSSLSISEKSDIIRKNYKTASSLNRRSVSLRAPNSFVESPTKPKEEIIKVSEPDEKFALLYQRVLTASIDDIPKVISSVISPSNLNYTRYINMLKLAIIKEITDLSNIAFENNSLDDEEVQTMYDELLDTYEAIDGLEEEEELIASSEGSTNTLFFRTSLNRVVLYEEIDKDIPSDMYDKVLELLYCLISGHFKGLKYLAAKKMFEVRLDEIRITFVRLSRNKFLLLNCFLKKYTTNKEYRERLSRIRDQYLDEKDDYVKRCNDPDFIAMHQKYLEDIIALCETEKRGIK